MALAAVVLFVAVLTAFVLWLDRPKVEVAPPPLAVSGTPPRSASPTAPSAEPARPLVVSVVGKVRRPGLVHVPDGARVADAIAKAGGPLPSADLTTVNLARRLADGEQILVGLPAAALPTTPLATQPSAPAGESAGTRLPGGKVNLNQATLEQLDSLPGVGPVTAQRILDWRQAHGRFSSVEQLREIEGIGERRFGQLKDQVSI